MTADWIAAASGSWPSEVENVLSYYSQFAHDPEVMKVTAALVKALTFVGNGSSVNGCKILEPQNASWFCARVGEAGVSRLALAQVATDLFVLQLQVSDGVSRQPTSSAPVPAPQKRRTDEVLPFEEI